MNRAIDTLKNQNQQNQNKVESFVISSANNSFVREYNDNEWYMGGNKAPKSTAKGVNKIMGTPAISETDQNITKGYTRASDLLYPNEPSQYHRRIESEDLVIKEAHEDQKIDFSQVKGDLESDFESKLMSVFKDIRYIVKCCDKNLETEKYFKSSISHFAHFSKEIWEFGMELLNIVSEKAQTLADKIESQSIVKTLQEQVNSLKTEVNTFFKITLKFLVS